MLGQAIIAVFRFYRITEHVTQARSAMISISSPYPSLTFGQQQPTVKHYQPALGGKGDTVHFAGRIKKIAGSVAIATGVAAGVGMGIDSAAQVSPFVVNVLSHSEDYHVNFTDLDLGPIKDSPHFPNLQKMAQEMQKRGIKRETIDIDFAYSMPNLPDKLSIGNFKLKLNGTLKISGNNWKLENGQLRGLPDLVDYNSSEHRNFVLEGITWIRGRFPHKPYYLVFDGEQSIRAEGKVYPFELYKKKKNTESLKTLALASR